METGHQVPVVQRVDSAIQWINYYPLDNAINFDSTYPLDSDLSNGLCYPPFEQLGPEVNGPADKPHARFLGMIFRKKVQLICGCLWYAFYAYVWVASENKPRLATTLLA